VYKIQIKLPEKKVSQNVYLKCSLNSVPIQDKKKKTKKKLFEYRKLICMHIKLLEENRFLIFPLNIIFVLNAEIFMHHDQDYFKLI
jgi:hypothetical protein